MNSQPNFGPERDDHQRVGVWRRLSGAIGRSWYIFLLALVPLYFLIAGIVGLVSGKLRVLSRSSAAHTIYGAEAVTWSWIQISLGLGLLGWMLGDVTRRAWLKWVLWLVAAGCFATGFYRLVKAI